MLQGVTIFLYSGSIQYSIPHIWGIYYISVNFSVNLHIYISTYLHIYISTYLQEIINSSHQRAGVNLSIPESPSKDLNFNSQRPSFSIQKRSTFWTNKQKVFSFCSSYPVGLAKKFDIKLFLSKKFRKINPNLSVCYYTLLSDHQFKSKVSLFHFCLFQLSSLKNE